MRRSSGEVMLVLSLGIALAATGAGAQSPQAEAPKSPEDRPPTREPWLPIDLRPVGADETDAVVVGERAPDASLEDTDGRWADLTKSHGRWQVVVFAADPKDLVPLASQAAAVSRLGANLVGVSARGWDELAVFAERHRIGFKLYSDPTREISRLWGMYDEADDSIEPGIVILDPNGVIHFTHQGPLAASDQLASLVGPVMGKH